MDIKEIYTKFDAVGSCTFATIAGEYPETRIAHFIGYDDEGLYFMTMNSKPFYRQLKETGKVAVLGLNAVPQIENIDDKELVFAPGYFIRLSGDAKEISRDEIINKNNPIFAYGLEDQKRYPAMVFFVIYRGRGEVFDYDFARVNRPYKLARERFTFGGCEPDKTGFKITDDCINCGKCETVCTFSAIGMDKAQEKRTISQNRCDECGSCMLVCPVQAIIRA